MLTLDGDWFPNVSATGAKTSTKASGNILSEEAIAINGILCILCNVWDNALKRKKWEKSKKEKGS